ncbi:MAG: CatB-related O-acetyltransferase [Neptunomonas phycophila]
MVEDIITKSDFCFRRCKIGKNKKVTLEYPARLLGTAINCSMKIGAYTYIRQGDIRSLRRIGRFCSIGPGLRVGDGMHPLAYLSTHPFQYNGNDFSFSDEYDEYLSLKKTVDSPKQKKPGIIGDDVWIGANVTIMRGVNIGTGAVIGSGAVVTRDVEPYEIVGGIPAKHIRFRFSNSLITDLLEAEWWQYTLPSIAGVPFDDPEKALEELNERRLNGKLILRESKCLIYCNDQISIA